MHKLYKILAVIAIFAFSVGVVQAATNVTWTKNGSVEYPNYINDFIGIASSSPMSTLSVVGSENHYGAYYHFGTVPSNANCSSVIGSSACAELVGTDNTTGGVGMYVVNTSAGTAAYTGYNLLNNLVGSATTNYAGTYLNSSNYTDTTFGTLNAVPNLLQVGNSMGAVSIQSFASTTAASYINFIAASTTPGQGPSAAMEGMRLTPTGLGIGTTTPLAKLDAFGFINTDATVGGYQIDNRLILTASSTLTSTSLGYLAGAATTTTGINNVFIGQNAGRRLTTGGSNVGIGFSALDNALTTNNAVAIGLNAMLSHTGSNVAVGQGSLAGSGGGANNIAIGSNAGVLDGNGANNIFLGALSGSKNSTGSNNIFLGVNTASTTNSQTGSNNIVLGYDLTLPVANGSNQLDIGNLIYGTGIDGQHTTVSSGNVGISSTTPWARLSVDSSNIGSAPAFAVGSSTSTSLVVNNAGQVAVNTITAAASTALTVNGTIVAGNGLRSALDTNDTAYFQNAANYTQFHMNNTLGATQGYVSINNNGAGNMGNPFNDTSPGMQVWTAGARRLSLGTNNQDRLTITPTGNSGFGSTTPYAKVAVMVGGASDAYASLAPTTAFAIGSTTQGTATTTLFTIDSKGHQYTGGITPAVSGGTSTVVGNDNNGHITVAGVLLTSVTLTFATAWDSAPDCTMADSSTGVTGAISSISTTQLVVGFSAGVNSGDVWYICQGHN